MGSFTETTEGLPEVSINQKLIDSLQPIRIRDLTRPWYAFFFFRHTFHSLISVSFKSDSSLLHALVAVVTLPEKNHQHLNGLITLGLRFCLKVGSKAF